MTKRARFPSRVQRRRDAAAERLAQRKARGDAGQLERLRVLGHGNGREARRLERRLEGS